MNLRKKLILAAAVAGVIFTLVFAGKLFETNSAGYYQIKQAAGTGTMEVRNKPGLYPQLFGSITTYQLSDIYYFSKSNIEGESGEASDPIKVRFNDGGTALISGSIKYKLSSAVPNQLNLHEDFKSYSAVKQDLIRQVVTEALMQTATLMKAEESYSTRRSEFTSLAEDQVKRGIFATMSKEMKMKDAEGNEFVNRVVSVKISDDGQAEVKKASPFNRYNIEVLQFVIKDIDFDSTIDNLIAKKKEAEQQKVVAKANAERAKQDAITAEEQGKALVAKAQAEKEVEKIKAVTDARKEFEVSQLARKKAEEDAKARLTKQRAEAEANKLLVAAGLTPLEKATIEKETAIGVAEKLATIQFPEMMIIGGSSNGQNLDPFQAVGLESFIKISEKLSEKKK